ncbi:acyl-coenzyme A amino acid N-acyltransferase 2-like, partial [Melanotaenia boesemani]|uniref:acyl-coenzyme A amino acid N-acyltransferase 2-like n=1 Tax=Melanotaenia boesemani TaxID=1250792 RepID=UPI001C05B7B8
PKLSCIVGEGPFPAVLDLYTFGGGLSEKRASLLASRGFLVLTVSLYGHDDQPKNIKEIYLDYFEEAINFLRKQEKVGSKGVGIISLSKSGDLALSAASFLPNVEAVVWISGCSANTVLPLYYKKKLILPALMFDPMKWISTESGAIISKDDLNWDSKAYMDKMVERLKHHGKDNFETLSYPGAGHYLEQPYGPYCPSSFHGVAGKPVLWGGEPATHAAAEVHLWKKIQEFFRTHVSCDTAQAKAKL